VGSDQRAGEFRSRFGGLWIDRHDSSELLAERVRSGALTPELAELIERFNADGYVVIPGAVPREVTERVREDLDRFWADPPEGALVEHWHLWRTRFVPPDPRLRTRNKTKLLDYHAFSPVAREAIAAPKVVEFLSAIFEAKPKAFQSLTFWRGSQQAIHKDTAYVRIADEPLHFAATWLALEDVEEGTGELEYYVGSHHDPDYVFAGGHKSLHGSLRDHQRYLSSLHADAERYGHPKRTFLAEEGDVLVWHADLAHGGSRIRRRGSTRQSLVTHFTPEPDDPPFAREVERVPVEAHGCLFISHHRQI
jgi:hypothetical protein